MLLLVSGATKTYRQYANSPYLGRLIEPLGASGLRDLKPGFFAADNAAFKTFSPALFCSMLGKIAGKPGCLFVACPDVVGNARETARLFYQWQPILKALGLPVALVLQDGIETVGVPWNMIDALFIGGSTAFKLGPIAARMVREGKERGKWIHCGRVNSLRRFRYAAAIGCDSVDGTKFSKWPNQALPRALAWLEEIDRQPSLALAA